MNNSVTIYSNGITAFTRTYKVKKEGSPISIPVRKTHISDVLGSLNVFGNVTLVEPPSFTPTNAHKSALTIESDEVLDSLLTQLSGTNVKVTTNANEKIEGTLFGKQVSEQDSGSYKVTMQHVLVQTTDGIRAVDLEDVKLVEFTEEDIKAEINKALKSKRQSIKPESTFVNLMVSGKENNTDAIVQYTVPTAAWSINYRLTQNKGKFSLEGYAVVHNNTDEDWNDFILSVVTGEPLTFSSDLDEQKQPRRQHVSFVKDVAEGGNRAEVGFAAESFSMCDAVNEGAGLESVGRSASMALCAAPASASAKKGLKKAKVALTDSSEVGDFTIWTGKDAVSIKSQQSALVPLFVTALDDAKTVLYYKQSQNPTRPYRAIKFTNTSGWSLGYGPCAVYNNNLSEGNCTLDACKPGEDRLLLHAKETGVRVMCESPITKATRTKVALSSGIATDEITNTAVTTYVLKNSKKDPFSLELDHKSNFSNPEVKSSHPVSEKLSDGVRIKVELAENGQTTVSVTETLIVKNQFTITTDFLNQMFIETKDPLSNNAKIKEVMSLKEELDKTYRSEQVANERVGVLTNEQKRIRENLNSFDQKGEEAAGFRKGIMVAEEELKKLQGVTLPTLKANKVTAQKALDEAIKKLSATWELVK